MEKPDNDPESIPSIFWRAHQERKAALRQALGLPPLPTPRPGQNTTIKFTRRPFPEPAVALDPPGGTRDPLDQRPPGPQSLGLDPLAGVKGRPAGGGGGGGGVGVGAPLSACPHACKAWTAYGSSIEEHCIDCGAHLGTRSITRNAPPPPPTMAAHACPTFNPYCQDCIDGASPEPTRAPDQWYSHASEQEIVEALVDCYRGGSWQEFLQRLRKRGLEVVKRRA